MKKMFMTIAAFLLLGSMISPTIPLNAADKNNDEKRTQDPVTEVVGEPEASQANLVVVGPDKVKMGELVVISVEESIAASYKWIVLPETKDFMVIDGGKRAVFSSSKGGTYKFFISCGLGDTVDSAVHVVNVRGGVSPRPSDDFATRLATYCEKVVSDTKRDDCLALAQSFSSVALIMDGTGATPSEIVKATFKSNQDALGSKLDNWLPFRTGLSRELKMLADGDKLSNTASHVTVWKQIANALRFYASTL